MLVAILLSVAILSSFGETEWKVTYSWEVRRYLTIKMNYVIIAPKPIELSASIILDFPS